ncbi:MAG: acetate/propionate family kinase [Anaerolineales bacterium]|jgi:acetate kinase
MQHILTINGGSSSVKFALFEASEELKRLLSGRIQRIGSPDTEMEVTDLASGRTEHQAVLAADHASVIQPLARFIEKRVDFDQITAVVHRIVHGGMRYSEPALITPDMLAYLVQISPYDPEHLPTEIAMIRTFTRYYPNLMQAACFDTAFHRDMPRVVKILSIPRRYFDEGVQRYGFHGVSCEYLIGELERLAGKAVASGRVILAHLGNGASMTAVYAGKSIDTTMAFTPTAGLVMGTRTGDLDPGLAAFLAHTEKMTPAQFYKMANYQSGMLGVSGTSSDMHDLVEKELDDPYAADAIALFCYTARKFIGAYAAALNGLDTLVFSGGIGENSGLIRARICNGLEFLGLELDPGQNDANAPLISTDISRVSVRVIKTDEELQMARSVRRLLQ